MARGNKNAVPPPPGPGRPKGVPNKLTTDVKQMIRQALEEEGGVQYLRQQAQKNPQAFMTLIGKLVPIDVDVTKTQINVVVGLYPEEQINERYKPDASHEAIEGIH